MLPGFLSVWSDGHMLCRMTVLAAICTTQAFMMWKFINFQLRRWRENAQNTSQKKKTTSTKTKSRKGQSSLLHLLSLLKTPHLPASQPNTTSVKQSINVLFNLV